MAGILGIVPLAQSIALAGHSAELVTKKDKDVGDFIGHGVTSIVGAKLIGETANITGSF